MGDATEVGLPRAIAIAWGMEEVPQRGPSRGLSHERIVAAGIELADREGLGAVTMKAVAESLGFTTMSLYRYVSGKDELLELMQDQAGTLPDEVELDEDWRVAIRQWAQLLREGSYAHPWTLELPRTQRALLMPNATRVADLGLRALSGLQVTDEDRIATILMVSQHVISMVSLSIGLASEGVIELGRDAMELLGEVLTTDRFPHLAPLLQGGGYVVADEGSGPAERDLTVDYEYDFGLDRIIAGLEALERERAAEGHGGS